MITTPKVNLPKVDNGNSRFTHVVARLPVEGRIVGYVKIFEEPNDVNIAEICVLRNGEWYCRIAKSKILDVAIVAVLEMMDCEITADYKVGEISNCHNYAHGVATKVAKTHGHTDHETIGYSGRYNANSEERELL